MTIKLQHAQTYSLVAMRLAMGWMFFYAGITKVLNPAWTSAGYLENAKTFSTIYDWLASPTILPAVDFMNKWGLVLIGISLILGIAVRLSSWLGAILMFLYYLPILSWPYPNPHSYLVDEHIIYMFAFFVLGYFKAGRIFGLEHWFEKLPLVRDFPKFRHLLG